MLNKVQLIGITGNKPELKTVENGNPFATFSMATSENYKDEKGEKKTITEWHNIVANGKLANLVVEHLDKGKKVYVEGKLRTSTKENADGTKAYFTNIKIDTIEFLSPKNHTEESPE